MNKEIVNRAIVLAIMAALFNALMDATAKYLVADYPVMPLLAIRSMIMVFLLAVYGFNHQGISAFKTRRPGAHAIRVLFLIATSAFFFLSLRGLPLTDATVIFFGGTFFIVALSYPILGERVGLHRGFAVMTGFVGILIVIRPEFDNINLYSVYGLLAALFYAITLLYGRKMKDTENTFSLVLFGNIGIVILGSLFIPFQWVPIAAAALAIIFLLAIFALGSHICLIQAFSMANAGVVTPFEYTGVLWAMLIGYFLFGEVPGIYVTIGAGVVIAAGIYVILRENRGS